MRTTILALFLLAAIAGKGQTTDTIRIGPYGFLRSKYPEALYDFDPVWDRIVLMERRLDSLQHRLDSLEKWRQWWNGGLSDGPQYLPVSVGSFHTLTDKEKGIVPVNAAKKGGKP